MSAPKKKVAEDGYPYPCKVQIAGLWYRGVVTFRRLQHYRSVRWHWMFHDRNGDWEYTIKVISAIDFSSFDLAWNNVWGQHDFEPIEAEGRPAATRRPSGLHGDAS